jgi:predicted nucleic acid-binding protein
LGESSAIALALETQNARLILDDKKARKYAKSLKLDIAGTYGILRLAEERHIITDVMNYVERLRKIGFRI